MTIKIALLATALALVSSAASATVVDNTTLAVPPGVYFGNGNVNSGFTVNTIGNVEIGLSAITRFVGPITPVGDVYSAPTGATTVPSQSGSDWGFIFSINLDAGGTGTKNLSNITTSLSLTDVGAGTTGAFNVLLISDNTEFGSAGKCTAACVASANYAVQNSEALSFSTVAAALNDPYKINANDTYIFDLSVFSTSTDTPTLIGTDEIQVKVGSGAPVPEPLTLSLFGAGLAGAALIRRRKAPKA